MKKNTEDPDVFTMEMVEVDVKLFIKCRMCLDEDGVYQIVPSLRELIKDCFDIDTDPFDGLPQLICKKCKSTLSDYHAVKNTFKLKQLNLKEKLVKIKNNFTLLKSETGSCNEINKNGEKPTSPVPLVSAVTTMSPVQSVASVAPVKPVEPVASVQLGMPVQSDIQTALDDSEVINDTWKKTYNERYICKICTKSYQRYASIKRHVKTHKKLLKKHKKVFRKYCTVHLNKIDNKENCTGSAHVVVYNTDKIITSKGNSHYHLLYLKKDCSIRQATNENGKVSDKRPGLFSDSEEEIIKPKKRKTRRLYSGSSTKTTVLEDTTNDITAPVAKNDTYVAANSVNKSEASSKKKIDTGNTIYLSQREVAKANIANYKAIQNIVTMCQKKYIKRAQSKSETKPPVSESSLKHKVLSLGRKVIHKQGFECTGLLRYMEYKDLEISWQPATRSNKKKNSNFVRIMTKLKSREDLENDDSSWKDLHKITFVSNQAINGDDINTDGIDPSITPDDNEKSTIQPQLKNGEDQIDPILTNNCDDLNSKNKLLNKTPVANPKQLPKKIITEMKPTTIKTSDAVMLTTENGQTENAEVKDNQLCMPIITSTCSLSTVVEKEKQTDPAIEKPAPRIKVKPPSELMSERALNNQSQSEDIWAFNKRHASLPYHFTNTTVYAGASVYQSQVENQSNDGTVLPSHSTTTAKTNSGNDTNLEYVTLHCMEFPNEKTKFPFQYFKRVLQCHGFELLEINEDLPPNFTCLVTCKLLLKQDTIRPLGVWLSLFCSNNSFCFAFKDTHLRKFNPNQLPAFWQWELLKIYKGDVVDKILQNALKVSKEVHSYTNNFLCLLKSIRCISEP